MKYFQVIIALYGIVLMIGKSQADLKVVTSIKPIQFIASAIQDGVGKPKSLLPANSSPHTFTLKPSDVKEISSADLFYWIGPDMEVSLTKILNRRTRGSSIALQNLSGLKLRYFESNDTHTNPAVIKHIHGAHTLDGHLWLSTNNARIIAEKMAIDMGRLDPENLPKYKRNLKYFIERMKELEQLLKERMSGLHDKPFFVFHEGFNYFESDYNLKHRGVFTQSQANQPGAKHLNSLYKSLLDIGKSCVFTEPALNPHLVKTLTTGMNVQSIELDLLGSSIKPGLHAYEKLIYQMAMNLSSCLLSL